MSGVLLGARGNLSLNTEPSVHVKHLSWSGKIFSEFDQMKKVDKTNCWDFFLNIIILFL